MDDDNNRTAYSAAIPFALSATGMTTSSSDVVVLGLGVVLAGLYLFKDQLFAASKPKIAPVANKSAANGSGNPRDFIAKMKEGVRPCYIRR